PGIRASAHGFERDAFQGRDLDLEIRRGKRRRDLFPPRQQNLAHEQGGADQDKMARFSRCSLEAFDPAFPRAADTVGELGQLVGLWKWPEPARTAAFEEREAELFLDRMHPFRKRRLGEMEALTGAGEVRIRHESLDELKMFNF